MVELSKFDVVWNYLLHRKLTRILFLTKNLKKNKSATDLLQAYSSSEIDRVTFDSEN